MPSSERNRYGAIFWSSTSTNRGGTTGLSRDPRAKNKSGGWYERHALPGGASESGYYIRARGRFFVCLGDHMVHSFLRPRRAFTASPQRRPSHRSAPPERCNVDYEVPATFERLLPRRGRFTAV